MTKRPRLEAVLLDVDGTLLDSNDAHARAWSAALVEAGREIPWRRIRPLIGMGGDKLLPAVSDLTEDMPEGRRVAERRKAIFAERFLPHLGPFPGARPLLERMRADGLRLVVATSAAGDELKGLLDQAGVADLIDAATSASDADQSKPAPDIVLAALEQAGAPNDRVKLLGDTPYDLAAATRAGVGFVGVRCGGWDAEALAGAEAVYADPADLLARYASSPFGRR